MSEYRYASGWVDYTTLTTTDAYKVSEFPSSGYYEKPWRVESVGAVTAELVPVTLSRMVYQEGGLSTEWDFGATTPARYGWLRANRPVGGKVTIMTYRINPDAVSGAGVGWIAMICYVNLIGGIQRDATGNSADKFMPSVRLVFSGGTLLSPP